MAIRWSLVPIYVLASQNPGLPHHMAAVAVARAPSIESELAWILPAATRLLEVLFTQAPRSKSPRSLLKQDGGSQGPPCSQEIPSQRTHHKARLLGPRQALDSLTMWHQWLWPGSQKLSSTWLGYPRSHQAAGSSLHPSPHVKFPKVVWSAFATSCFLLHFQYVGQCVGAEP